MATPQNPPVPLIFDPTTKRAYRFWQPGFDGEFGLPTATQVGQVLFSCDGVTFTPELPITGDDGWLVNEDGIHIVNG